MPRSHLPFSYKGLPVAHIAAWSGERLPKPLVVRASDGVAFADAVGANGQAQGRDRAGVLWERWALRQGDGEALFDVVHAPRQKRAMRKLLCQVCGGPSDENEQGRLWLLEDYRGVEGWPEREVTVHPPVCLRCAPLAASLCPHLRGKVAAVRARQVSLDGVYGMVYASDGGPLPVPVKKKVVFNDDWRRKWTVGAQLAATLTDCTVVDLEELSAGAGVRTCPVRSGFVA
ncbi:hypothetical protein [Streptomyces europaeiscabiei]|uniref:hypothetical protein n=1 Tax=Streptomyces europaeiscabiei TaxID=146819 RepID=UPI0029A100D1|nr:hypothetical protein [Streptomyces europaeiscabiei]MDX3672679.1 hypothetical protein [Streptomyces europaeiscabiei]